VSEDVLVVQNSSIVDYIQGGNGSLTTERSNELINKILGNHMFMPRDKAEYDFEHKQVIPYVIIRDKKNYLLLKRTSKQTEKRLHNKYSLGIGGHINPEPSEGDNNIIIKGLYRELNEEVSLKDPSDLNFIGIINDESNSVSRVHLGLLYVQEVLSPGYEVLETEKMTAEWVTEDKLQDHYNELETWSQIVYDYYINK